MAGYEWLGGQFASDSLRNKYLKLWTAAPEHICFGNKEKPFGRVGGELKKFGRESSQGEEDVAGLIAPASLRQVRDFGL
jgi:hypothetical protein